MTRPDPKDAPREFRVNEMFFSTTDRKGTILAGNDVFVRVSGYAREELVGSPHNIIRHPEMPRAVFRLVWKHLLAGQPLAALVKNLAKDGCYYWVVALLMPVKAGFLSIRFKPTGALLPVIERVYREMVAIEGERGREQGTVGMDTAERRLGEALAAHGFEDYAAFMRTLLHDELKSRDTVLVQQERRLFPEALPGEADAELATIFRTGLEVYAQLQRLYARLDEFVAINEGLGAKSKQVLGMTGDFRFIAFNAALRSSRLGEEGRALTVIADYLSSASVATGMVVGKLGERVGQISETLRRVIFNLAAARLQMEMVLNFCAERAGGPGTAVNESGASDLREQMIATLQDGFAETIGRAVAALGELEAGVKQLEMSTADVSRLVLTLQVAQVGGLVESRRLADDDTFTVMFTDLREGVETTRGAIAELTGVSERLAVLAVETPGIARAISGSVEAMAAAVDGLATRAAAGVTEEVSCAA